MDLQKDFMNKLKIAFGKKEYGRCKDLMLHLEKVKLKRYKLLDSKTKNYSETFLMLYLQELSKIFKTFHCPPLDPLFDPFKGLEDEEESKLHHQAAVFNLESKEPTSTEPTATKLIDEYGITEEVFQARQHASDAFELVQKSVGHNSNTVSQSHLRACQMEIQVAMNALLRVSSSLSKAVASENMENQDPDSGEIARPPILYQYKRRPKKKEADPVREEADPVYRR